MQVEVFAQDAIGVIGAEYPIVEFGNDPAFWFRLREEGRLGGDEHLARSDAFGGVTGLTGGEHFLYGNALSAF